MKDVHESMIIQQEIYEDFTASTSRLVEHADALIIRSEKKWNKLITWSNKYKPLIIEAYSNIKNKT